MRTLNRLSDRTVKTASPGKYHDGGGLYLVVTPGRNGTNRNWSFRYSVGNGKHRYCGFGAYPLVSLQQARQKTADARELLAKGIDPIAHKTAVRASLSQQHTTTTTFRNCADAYIKAHRASWRNVRHAHQWVETLDAYVNPVFGELPVSEIDTQLVLRVLEPVWTEKTETASRIRSRIELILDWAKVREYRKGENPARWRGHLDKLLPRPAKLRPVKHHAALAYGDVPDLMAELRQRESIVAAALQFVVLTAARTNEALGARWDEIDLLGKVWTLPAERMKGGRPHRVPLSVGALKVLDHMSKAREGEYVFPGARQARLSPRAMNALLLRMKRVETVHGFRSSFRDWCAEQTNFPREIAEAALAHAIPNATEAAYRRSDFFERRRRLMAEWSDFCDGKGLTGEIVPFRTAS